MCASDVGHEGIKPNGYKANYMRVHRTKKSTQINRAHRIGFAKANPFKGGLGDINGNESSRTWGIKRTLF